MSRSSAIVIKSFSPIGGATPGAVRTTPPSEAASAGMVPLIVPTATSVAPREGSLSLEPATVIVAAGAARPAGELLRDLLAPAVGWAMVVSDGSGQPDADAAHRPTSSQIRLIVEPTRTDLGAEGYVLTAGGDGVDVVAAGVAGLRWAVQTLRQLLPPQVYGTEHVDSMEWVIPAAEIRDVPRFSWRGVMIDLARWFRPIAEVRRLIDLAAIHKLNVVHLHLTDDQGWRFESHKYPCLTEVGAWRAESMVGPDSDETFDGVPHGGLYTQAELRELVAYADRLGVALLPEIDVPGHMRAAIAAYPELGNNPDTQLGVGTRWGVIEEVLNVEDATVDFVTDILDEVMEVFPSPYIHVGGDECPRTEWAASARAQERKRELGLTSDDQLQAWFMSRLADHLAAHGRKLVGWDEILDGGIADGATVLSWRGEEGGIAAAQAGHDVVMAPEQVVYLDHYQGDPATEPWAPRGMNTLDRILAYNPVPEVLTAEQATHVLGTQSNVWVEYIPTREHLDYMVFPRLSAVSEVAWGSPDRDPRDFLRRLPEHLRRLDALGVGYRAHSAPEQ